MGRPIKILIIGNGFGGTYALKRLHKFFHKDRNVELSIIGDKNYFLFTPLLHEVATGGINPENIIEPIRKVLGCCLKNFYLGTAELINTTDCTVSVGENIIPYDYLVLAPGAQTNFYNIPGAEKYSFPLKTIRDAIKIKNQTITMIEKASHSNDSFERKKMLRFVIVGGGPTGVELAAELQELIYENFSHYYSKDIIQDSSVVLIQRESQLMMQFGPKMRQKSLEILKKKGVDVMLNMSVTEVGDSYVTILSEKTGGKKLETETVIWSAGIKPNILNFDIVPERSPDGRLIVNEYLQLKDHKEIFAIGDIALFKTATTALPALAQVAEKEARHVAQNIQFAIRGKQLKPFSFSQHVSLVSLGQWAAIGEVFNFTFWGGITWWIWRTVYLSKLISFRKKLRVALDWTIDTFSARDISQI
jgi:NADH dehydrogenase